ncbi:hypothetical protein [Liquorilactobacillus hordei]|uniref:hypothetical protein n=1 Tax=Liquorilactobacillus hordei TaxID=468911 RepID=UPI001CBCEC39|nr:hypothetical protein [Liquorilactobacillus hordei]MBZ2406126.1 hypothetical protein [Liquorilactobacillus hordei]
MKLETIYPSLVEQMYSAMKNSGVTGIDKALIYKEMVEDKMIDANGTPTKKALNERLVTDATERSNMTLLEFKKIYPIFKKFPAKEFAKYDGRWYVSDKILDFLVDFDDRASFDERAEISAYLTQRNYENPQTIGELKGTIPAYRDVDDSHFHETSDGVLVDIAAAKEQCKKVISGQLSGDIEAAKEILDKFKKY